MPEFAVKSAGALCAEDSGGSRNRDPPSICRGISFVTRIMSVNCAILEVRLDFLKISPKKITKS